METQQGIARETQLAGNLTAGRDKNRSCPPGIESTRVLTKRGRGQAVDVIIGIGHPETSAEHILRDLAYLAQKGVRTAVVRETAGFSSVVSRKLPAGLFAMRTADRITAYRSEAGLPVAIASVLCAAAAVPLTV